MENETIAREICTCMALQLSTTPADGMAPLFTGVSANAEIINFEYLLDTGTSLKVLIS